MEVEVEAVECDALIDWREDWCVSLGRWCASLGNSRILGWPFFSIWTTGFSKTSGPNQNNGLPKTKSDRLLMRQLVKFGNLTS
jgi:hypothetical protein